MRMVVCEVCRVVEKKYCCPKCSVVYCSLACFKQHKEGEGCRVEEREGWVVDTAAEQVVAYQFPTADTVPMEKLQLLAGSAKLRHLLDNPHLRTFLTTLDSSEDKGRLMRKAMREPLFVEFVDSCLEALGEVEGREVTDQQILQAMQDKMEEDD